MPWKEICAMDERVRFVGEVLADEESMSALCAYYGISRTTGYKWLARFDEAGRRGLQDRSRAPHRIVKDVVLCAARRQHPNWLLC